MNHYYVPTLAFVVKQSHPSNVSSRFSKGQASSSTGITHHPALVTGFCGQGISSAFLLVKSKQSTNWFSLVSSTSDHVWLRSQFRLQGKKRQFVKKKRSPAARLSLIVCGIVCEIWPQFEYLEAPLITGLVSFRYISQERFFISSSTMRSLRSFKVGRWASLTPYYAR